MSCRREHKQRKMERKGPSEQSPVLGEMNEGSEKALRELPNYSFDINLFSADSDEVITRYVVISSPLHVLKIK